MFRIALCQLGSSNETDVIGYKRECMEKAEKAVREASACGADIICLPEMWYCPYSNSSFPYYKEPVGGECYSFLKRLAKHYGVYLIGGSIPEEDGEKIYNTCFVFDPDGNPIARHRKVHMFNVNIPGGQCFCESDTLSSGDEVTVFDTQFGKIGVIICFDIRFADFVRKEAVDCGAKMIFMPASFNMTTGPAHWDLTLRARALDNQIFIAGCAPARNTESEYVSFANSAVAGPWGDFKAHAGFDETILYCNIDYSELDMIRNQLPIISARKPHLY